MESTPYRWTKYDKRKKRLIKSKYNNNGNIWKNKKDHAPSASKSNF